METVKNKAIFFIIALILCTCLSACGSKSNSNDPISGTWEMTSMEVGGKTTSAADYLKSSGATKAPVLEFEGNGKATLDMDGDSGSGRWENTNGQYSLTYKKDGEETVKELVVDGNQLTMEQNGYSLTYEKQ